MSKYEGLQGGKTEKESRINFGYTGAASDHAEIKKLFSFQRDFQLLELSEPDWCVYHAKVATRFMCGAGSNSNI